MNKSIIFIAVLFAHSLLLSGCAPSTEDAYSAANKAYQQGEFEEAIELFTQAARTSGNPAIYANRANCYSELGNLDAALKDYETAIDKALEVSTDVNDPRLATLYYNRGYAYEIAGKFEQAISDYEKTISLNEDYPDVKNNLAWLLATIPDEKLRDPARAVTMAKIQCEKTEWKNDSNLDTLAAAHAAAGDFTAAIERQKQAIELSNNAEMIKNYQVRLELYRNSTPFILTAKD